MKKLYFLIKFIIFSFFSISIIVLGFYAYAYLTPKENLTTANQILIYDDENNLVFENSSDTSWITLDKISKNVIDATISAEDKNFYSHKGFDYLRIIKAMFNNVSNGNINEGASTISQQYIKNLLIIR